jgi:hypothetical protein
MANRVMGCPPPRPIGGARRRSAVWSTARAAATIALSALDALGRARIVGRILPSVELATIAASPLLVEQRATARAATLVREERVELDGREDPPAARPAGKRWHRR